MTMNIMMTDLKGQYQSLQTEIDTAIHSVFESGHYILSSNVTKFEHAIAEYCGVKHAIAVASGTDALHLALRAIGVGAGDEVITTSFTFIGTAEAISHSGARPVFVDIEPDTFNIDIEQIEASIGPKTRAIIAVHLFGQPAELDAIKALCQKYGLALIEDCAQSFGADYHGKKTGSFGDLGCFSFYPSKNLGGAGDGGMIVTNNDKLADTVHTLRNHGSRAPYQHSMIGYNSRLDELQAAILLVKLNYIDQYNEKRREIARFYKECLQNTYVITPVERELRTHVYHQYTIRSDKRDLIRQGLADAGIASAVHYSIPLHQQEVYREQYSGVYMPMAENAAASVLSLPIYPELTPQQIELICQHVIYSH